MASTQITRKTNVSTYPALFRKVKETLLDGQRRIDAERVRTYWETGRLIQEHILQNKDRAQYGGQVMDRLAGDLSVSRAVLNRCVQFVGKYPKYGNCAPARELTWSHYQELIGIADDDRRSMLEKAIVEGALTRDEVRARKNSWRGNGYAVIPNPTGEESPVVDQSPCLTSNVLPLTPLKGQLYTYQIINPKGVAPDSGLGLAIDLGFSNICAIDKKLVTSFRAGDIVESVVKEEDVYRFTKSGRASKDLYTYQAFVERVIDGDTLKVNIDFGFNFWSRHTLRLRGIDCPELGTKDGDQAKAYVQSLIKEADRIVIRSSRDDKYGRYLADVFLPAGTASTPEVGEVFLNNLLLEKGFAVCYE